MTTLKYFQDTVAALAEEGVSDVRFHPPTPIAYRLNGQWVYHEDKGMKPGELEDAMRELLSEPGFEQLERTREADTAVQFHGRNYRMNVAYARDRLMVTLRTIPGDPPTLDELNFIDHERVVREIRELMSLKQGLVLVTGPTGSGKSTTLAAGIRFYNENFQGNIVTIEDPVEFIHTPKKAVISQREVGSDTLSFQAAMRGVLRQAPDVILLGEIRDEASLNNCLQAAESGHLVLGTLHTASAPGAVGRVIEMAPPERQHIVKAGLINSLQGVIAQRLVRTEEGMGRQVVVEILRVDNLMRLKLSDPGLGNSNIRSHMETSRPNQLLMTTQLAHGVLEGRFTEEGARGTLVGNDLDHFKDELKSLPKLLGPALQRAGGGMRTKADPDGDSRIRF